MSGDSNNAFLHSGDVSQPSGAHCVCVCVRACVRACVRGGVGGFGGVCVLGWGGGVGFACILSRPFPWCLS